MRACQARRRAVCQHGPLQVIDAIPKVGIGVQRSMWQKGRDCKGRRDGGDGECIVQLSSIKTRDSEGRNRHSTRGSSMATFARDDGEAEGKDIVRGEREATACVIAKEKESREHKG